MEKYYKQIQNKCMGIIFLIVQVTLVQKIVKILDVGEVSKIIQNSATFFKGSAPVIATNITNIINLLIKLDIFPSKCKIVKIKPLFKKVSKNITLLTLTSKVIEKKAKFSLKKWTAVQLSIRL